MYSADEMYDTAELDNSNHLVYDAIRQEQQKRWEARRIAQGLPLMLTEAEQKQVDELRRIYSNCGVQSEKKRG